MKVSFKKHSVKTAVVIALCICIAAGAAGGVWAYLLAQTERLPNDFVPAHVTCAVEETFENGIKSNVHVRNTSNIGAYIRVVVLVNFVSADGKVHSTSPVEGVDYSITWTSSGWKKGSDGFWYCVSPVSPGGLTPMLIETAKVLSAPEGYALNIRIIAAAIQSNPSAAVEEAWGITPVNGTLHPN